jgi:3'(2'), 5'-bisphosphate nucleotidase
LGEGAWKIELIDGIFPSDWKKDCNLLPIKSINKKCFTVVGSRSHVSKDTEKYISDLKKEHNQLDFISMGSSLKLCLVAEGKADVYPRLAPTMEWDTAAGDAIARSAGCRVVDYNNGENLRYNKENLINPWFIVHR